MNETPLPVLFENIPESLREPRQWVVWKYEESRQGKPTKIPHSAKSGKRIDAMNSVNWVYFDEAKSAYETGEWAGIGLSLVSGLIAIDFDHVYTDHVEKPYIDYMRRLETYFELSPSGRGARGFLHGRLPGSRTRGAKNNLRVELYDHNRFVTVTGHIISPFPRTIARNDETLLKFYHHLFPAPQIRPQKIYAPAESEDDIVTAALSAKNAAKFQSLLQGNWQPLGYASKSEADLGFVSMLAFWSNGNAAKMDAIFRRSGLFSEKWDEQRGEKTYGERTIEKAISSMTIHS